MRGIKSGLTSILAIGLLAGSAVGVAAQEEGDESLDVPSPFRAEFRGPGPGGESLWDPETRITRGPGLLIEATDPRVSGLFTGPQAWGGVGPAPIDLETGEPVGITIDENKTTIGETVFKEAYWHNKGGIRIDNDDGSWVGTTVNLFIFEKDERTRKQRRKGKGKEPIRHSGAFTELTGEGGYDGLSIIMSESDEGIVGVIIPTDTVPTQPEPPVARAE